MAYTLQILHASDLEGGLEALENAPNFAAIVEALEADAELQGIDSILLSAGDNYIPGPFFNAGGDFSLSATYEGFYNELFGLIDTTLLSPAEDTNGDGFYDNDEIQAFIDGGAATFEQIYVVDVNGDGVSDYFEELDTHEGRIDISIMNVLGFDAAAVGNHEFDFGTDAFENIINYDSEEGNSLSGGRYGTVNYLQEVDWAGVQFPYLSANLDFSQDGDVGDLFTDEILPNAAFRSDLLSARQNPADPSETGSDSNDAKVAPATILERSGEMIGVLGATTQLIATISSTGSVNDVSSPGVEDMAALAAVLQPAIDDLEAQGINKIILVSHLQQLALEQELATLLSGIDVIIAGGSDTLLADSQDTLRPGDVAADDYPQLATNLDGDPVAIVSTDGEYSYLGRLVVEFDDDGVVIPGSIDENVSGAFATDEAGVLAVTGEATLEDAIAASEKASDVEDLVEAVTDIVIAIDGDVAGEASVYLNGERSAVRTEETNLGNLTADANLAAAQAVDPEVLVSIKNGGGIRAAIGEIVDLGGGEVEKTPTAENPLSGKEAGEVSELDIDNSLRFNNGLVTVELTPQELKIVLEHAVAATGEGATPGQFFQVGGIHVSFDPEGTAQEILLDGNDLTVVTPGTRIQNVSLIDEEGVPVQAIIVDGEVAPGAPASIKVVTLNFLADQAGDGYPFRAFSEITDLMIGEQEALSNYLRDNFPEDGPKAFDDADTAAGMDARIQNLAVRSDTVDAPIGTMALGYEAVAEFQGADDDGDVEGASEVVAHEDGLLYTTNGALGLIEIFDIASETKVGELPLAALEGYDGVQSVAVKNGVVAAAIAREPVEQDFFGETALVSQPGFVALFDAETLELLGTVDVGNLPDAVTFTPDGQKLLVAGEGEKNGESDHEDDPLGTVAIVDVSDPTAPVAQIVDFTQFNGLEALVVPGGGRIQPGTGVGVDFEPEYIAVSPDGTTAFVTLQENNAIAKIDIATGHIAAVWGLGTVDYASESQLDALDDGVIDIRNYDNLVGWRMPDAIAAFEVNGETYVATANEGDSRDFDEDRVADLVEDGLLDEALVADLLAQGLIDEDEDTDVGLERLEVSTVDGDTDGDGDIDVLHTFSSRSFSIFDADGNLVFDSGPEFEKIIAELAPERFNDDDGGDGENRSDAKGPEPEAIATGQVGESLYAFIGLERDSGIMIYDISDPANAHFVKYIAPKFVELTPEEEIARQGPEVIAFIPAEESTSGKAQIAVAYEISGSTIVYDLEFDDGLTPIYEIQGAGHVSPYEGMEVTTQGIVTAVDFNGYYLQDSTGDGDDATSDGIFVFTGTGASSPVAVGDLVEITGTVSEFVPGGADTDNLSITEISTAEATILSSGNALPEAAIIGAAGRIPPSGIVISEGELPVNLRTDPGVFNPETDGIDFYESLEGMRVRLDDPTAVSTTNQFNETWILTDDGGAASPGLNDRGGINLNADPDGYGDLNPERVQVQYDSFFDLLPEGFEPPTIEVGDDLSDVVGVVSYDFGNYEVLVTEAFEIETPSANEAETTAVAGAEDRLSVATYNVLNVTAAPADGDAAQIAALAEQIVDNLGAPDILALQEIQDDSGVADDGTLSAEQTLQAIVDAIAAAGGPAYEFASAVVDEDGEGGGAPGANIRNAFLYNPERVEALEFVTLESDELAARGVTGSDAFTETRDPLLGVFEFNGETITLINVHNSSRFGSEPIFGAPQPFLQAAEEAREAQAAALNQVVDALLAENPDARVVVLGDHNTFEFTDDLAEILPGVGEEQVLTNLVGLVETDDAYSFIFDGNSQVLDHIFVSDRLLTGAEVDYVHVNNDFADFASDHEPVVASFEFAPVEGMVVAGTNRDDVLQGGAGADEISGGNGDDEIDGLGGDDEIKAGNGSDMVYGGAGNDEIEGGNGNDGIWGEAGDDLILGGNGDDEIGGGAGDDEIEAGNGKDRIDGGAGDDLLSGGGQADTFVFEGAFGADTIGGFNERQDTLLVLGAELEDLTFELTDDGLLLLVDGAVTQGSVLLLGLDDDLETSDVMLG